MLNILEKWDYRAPRDSIRASIFNVWEYYYVRKLLRKVGLQEQDWKAVIGNYKAEHFVFRKIFEWEKNPTDYKEYWCLNEQNEKMEYPCLYNILKSFDETWDYLQKRIGPNITEWKWGKIHHNHYPHTPFSQTPLKPLFHRSHPMIGNGRTVGNSVIRAEADDLNGVVSSNLRMVVSMKPGDTSYAVIDTGVSGSIFSAHYDDIMKIYHQEKYLSIVEKSPTYWEDLLEVKYEKPHTKI